MKINKKQITIRCSAQNTEKPQKGEKLALLCVSESDIIAKRALYLRQTYFTSDSDRFILLENAR